MTGLEDFSRAIQMKRISAGFETLRMDQRQPKLSHISPRAPPGWKIPLIGNEKELTSKMHGKTHTHQNSHSNDENDQDA